MRKKPKPERKKDYFNPFVELFMRPTDAMIEAQTNKEFHLGTKEFYYVPTIAGHVPMR